MGVDGFREDVITFISKAEGLPNGIPLPIATGIEHYKHGPHLEEYLDEFRAVMKEYDCFAVGEGPQMGLNDAVELCSEGPGQKLDMFKPRSIGQASRISGVTPADIAVLLIYLSGNK